MYVFYILIATAVELRAESALHNSGFVLLVWRNFKYGPTNPGGYFIDM